MSAAGHGEEVRSTAQSVKVKFTINPRGLKKKRPAPDILKQTGHFSSLDKKNLLFRSLMKETGLMALPVLAKVWMM